jgi:5-methylcytosine-specific restriction endonuclease McrA
MKVDPYLIFSRDKFTCQICNQPLDMSLYKKTQGKRHHKAPTLDHIVPASHGGSYSYENLQAAHKKCNEEKKNQMDKERQRNV